jgi:phospholipase C
VEFAVLRLAFAVLSACILISGCGFSGDPLPPATALQRHSVKHIVVIMQENRSFDNLFHGFPGADTVETGMVHERSVALRPISIIQGTDVDHSHPGWWQDWDNGKMDGFAHAARYPIPDLPYAYVPQSETVPYWTLASQFTLGDRMFQSNSGPSFPAHQYMIAGQSANADEDPNEILWGCDAPSKARVALVGPNGTDLPGIYPCFDYLTLADALDQRGISWNYYAPAEADRGSYEFSAYQAIRHIRFGPDWKEHIFSPSAKVLTDIQNGELAQVTWIVPELNFSDHAGKGATSKARTG